MAFSKQAELCDNGISNYGHICGSLAFIPEGLRGGWVGFKGKGSDRNFVEMDDGLPNYGVTGGKNGSWVTTNIEMERAGE